MGQKKLIKFEEIKGFANVFEYPNEMKGKWGEFFGNDNPIVLELACGKGEYTNGLAKLYPRLNFIGIDLKGNRIWRGAKNATASGLRNAAFIRSEIDLLGNYFEENDIAGIWLPFPDPYLRTAKIKKRLSHPKFLRIYQKLMIPGSSVHLKTDSPQLYRFTKNVIDVFDLELMQDVGDVHALSQLSPELEIITYYESLDIAESRKVHYLQFRISKDLPSEKDAILKELENAAKPG